MDKTVKEFREGLIREISKLKEFYEFFESGKTLQTERDNGRFKSAQYKTIAEVCCELKEELDRCTHLLIVLDGYISDRSEEN